MPTNWAWSRHRPSHHIDRLLHTRYASELIEEMGISMSPSTVEP